MLGIRRKKVEEEMGYTKEHRFDEKVVDRINGYIRENMLSLSAIATKAGMTYNQLYQMLHKNQLIKLREYVMVCKALGVPLDFFVKVPKVTAVEKDEDFFEPF